MKNSSKEKLFLFWMLVPAIILILIFTYYPMIKGITLSFYDYTLRNINGKAFIGLDNFKELLVPSKFNTFYNTILNTVIYIVVSLFFQFTIGFMLAMALRKSFRGKGLYMAIIYLPWSLSMFLIGLIWRWMFNGTSGVLNDILLRLHIITTPIGFLSQESTALMSVIAANIWYGIPFFIIMLTAALSGIPKELEEAAAVDGAKWFQNLFLIIIPYIKPVIVLTLLLRTIWIFNSPDLIYSMTGGGPSGSSRILTSQMMEEIIDLNYGMASAIAVVIIVLLAVYTTVYLTITKFEDVGGDIS